jgi:hypothetical protein
MYSTCLFCNGSLGANEAIEAFPVGRRLAFDAAKGRLWVVCRRCERWNLSPLEERWEAIDECERAFRDTKLRASSGEIGLARVSEGLELVRIGTPQRPEMAAWRYGDQFGRRTRRNVLTGAGVVGAMAAVFWGGPALGLYTGGVVSALSMAMQGGLQWKQRRHPIAQVVMGDAGNRQVLKLAQLHVQRTSLHTDGPEGWSLDVPWIGYNEQITYSSRGLRHLTGSTRLTGEEARRALAQILPHVNTMVGRRRSIQEAVHALEREGSPGQMIAAAARTPMSRNWHNGKRPEAGRLIGLPIPIRLALEMAVHEESERRALEGELHLLESAWRDAEEIAAIADDLLLSPTVEHELARLKAEQNAGLTGQASDEGRATSNE